MLDPHPQNKFAIITVADPEICLGAMMRETWGVAWWPSFFD